mgnify:FL=1
MVQIYNYTAYLNRLHATSFKLNLKEIFLIKINYLCHDWHDFNSQLKDFSLQPVRVVGFVVTGNLKVKVCNEIEATLVECVTLSSVHRTGDMNNYYYLHPDDYYRHQERKRYIASKYARNINEVIGKIDIGDGPPLLNRKYIWGRECKVHR